MPFIGNQPALSYTSFAVQHFTTSATTSYTLDYSVANENEIRLVINNVVQQPGSSYAYTASGTTLTLSAATSATDTMYAVFLSKAIQSVVPPSGSVTNAMLGETITVANGGTGATTLAGAGLSNTPAFGVRLSATQTGLADNVPTLIEFDTEDFDSDNAFDTSTHTFTVPSGKGGLYFLTACLHFNHPGQINYNNTQIFKNGSQLRATQFNSSSGDYEDEDSQIITTVENLSAGDAITIKGNANSGDGTVTQVTGGANDNHSFFRGFKLIGV
jgi:hypothetical protein